MAHKRRIAFERLLGVSTEDLFQQRIRFVGDPLLEPAAAPRGLNEPDRYAEFLVQLASKEKSGGGKTGERVAARFGPAIAHDIGWLAFFLHSKKSDRRVVGGFQFLDQAGSCADSGWAPAVKMPKAISMLD